MSIARNLALALAVAGSGLACVGWSGVALGQAAPGAAPAQTQPLTAPPPPPPITPAPVAQTPAAAPAPAQAAAPKAGEGADKSAALYSPRVTRSTADHSKFEALKGPFASGPEVTKACLTCHTEASKQVHKSIHWTWAKEIPSTGQMVGKKTVVNSFCGGIATNEPRCTSCHAGYGWKDANFNFASEQNVDCLVCHESTGTYVKAPAGAGNPPPKPIKFGGKDLLPPDWPRVAQSVGKPTRENCGVCHFYGGGGDAVKHGDMDSTLTNPTRATDVHMDVKGLNFQCTTCHKSEDPANGHVLSGSRYDPKAKDTLPASHRGMERTVATCESCHSQTPHKGLSYSVAVLNSHTDKVACQTCHIPEMARGGKATKMWWDWSTAGQMKDGKPFVTKDAKGNETYNTIKGTFRWEENVVPDYEWFDGTIRYSLVGDNVEINPKDPASINAVRGSYGDPKSRIWPFKKMGGKQAFDTQRNTFVYTNLFGQNDTAYWTNFNWDKAIEAGMKAMGQPYSGSYAFVETSMFWPLNHMVAPKDKALKCGQCHAEKGRMASLAGFYMPGRDNWRWLDILGWLAVAGTLAGVAVHGLLRFMASKKHG